jgi:hypothetical protein
MKESKRVLVLLASKSCATMDDVIASRFVKGKHHEFVLGLDSVRACVVAVAVVVAVVVVVVVCVCSLVVFGGGRALDMTAIPVVVSDVYRAEKGYV